MVKGAGVLSGGGVLVMVTVRVTTLHPQGMAKSEFPLPLEVVSSSLMDF
jgi:hypothetical protein